MKGHFYLFDPIFILIFENIIPFNLGYKGLVYLDRYQHRQVLSGSTNSKPDHNIFTQQREPIS